MITFSIGSILLFIGLVIVVAAIGSNPFQYQVLLIAIIFLILACILLLVGRKRMNLKKLIKQAEDKIKEVNNQSSTIIDEAKRDAEDRIEASKVEAEKIIKDAKLMSSETIKDAKLKSSEIINNAQLRSSKLITSVKIQHDNLVESVKNLSNEKEDLLNEVKKLNSEVLTYNAFILDYDNITSEECKDKLAIVKLKQKDLITTESAIIKNQTELQQIISNNMTVTVNKKIINNNIKQILRCFNTECTSLIENVTAKNIDNVRTKIRKSFETINYIFKTDGIELSKKLLELKFEELNLVYTYKLKKEQESEQQKAIKEQMLEEEKVRKEIEKEKQKIEKEETQFKNEISKLMSYLSKSKDEIQSQLYLDKIKELENKLNELSEDKKNVLEREKNTRAGFVYVISNIGSFGENVFKIGMTRRLEPMDRIKELSSASVPFEFDVHAMIFSDDAPTLENTLHNEFRDKEVNKINHRKEFFKVSLRDIEDVVKKNHNATVEFTLVAEAAEYRESCKINQV